ncbi:MAG: NADH-quinone oxidoreductase subunit L, partial [SAR324 cluster bacterium]|nr:NADH-quinone oxidoreductase subunit L [SAR324 cluster bacterium]
AFIEERLFSWFKVGELSVDFSFRLDTLSMLMCLFVTGVSTLIHFYAIGYMAEDISKPRFFAYMNLFLFSMLLLVLGANLPVLFIGWEGVGLCSYLLIGFWFKNVSYAAAGRKAFIINRIGDVGFLLAIFLIIKHFGTIDFYQLSKIFSESSGNSGILTFIALCLFAGAVGKSAQIPLFVWLPDAMAGPTPVSALIHAATMVTAGVYLLARNSMLFEAAPEALFVVSCIALITAFVAATIALVQNDIKKVLAYSTVSQLGLMFIATGAGAYSIAMFHVVTHAFFKACLFLGAGSVIHSCHHAQDMRQLGGLRRYMPVTAISYGIAAISISGIYPFAGFFSKHEILEALNFTTNPYLFEYRVVFIAAVKLVSICTAFYMARSFALTFLGTFRGHDKPRESPLIMTIPIGILAVLSILGGVLVGNWIFEYLAPLFGNAKNGLSEMSLLSGLSASWTGLIGITMGLLFYSKWQGIPAQIFSACGSFSRLLAGKYYLDEIYQALIVKQMARLSSFLSSVIDQSLLDGMVNGIAIVIDGSGGLLRYVQTGQLRHYAVMIFLGTVLFISYCLLW